jgi:hypothetical protein
MNTEDRQPEGGPTASVPSTGGLLPRPPTPRRDLVRLDDPALPVEVARACQTAMELQARGALSQAHKQYAYSIATCRDHKVPLDTVLANVKPVTPFIASALLGDRPSAQLWFEHAAGRVDGSDYAALAAAIELGDPAVAVPLYERLHRALLADDRRAFVLMDVYNRVFRRPDATLAAGFLVRAFGNPLTEALLARVGRGQSLFSPEVLGVLERSRPLGDNAVMLRAYLAALFGQPVQTIVHAWEGRLWDAASAAVGLGRFELARALLAHTPAAPEAEPTAVDSSIRGELVRECRRIMRQQSRGDDVHGQYVALLDACEARRIPARSVVDDAAAGRLTPYFLSAALGDAATTRMFAERCGETAGTVSDTLPVLAALHAKCTDLALALLDEYLDFVRIRVRLARYRTDDPEMICALQDVFEKVFDGGDHRLAEAVLRHLLPSPTDRDAVAKATAAPGALLSRALGDALAAAAPAAPLVSEALRRAFTASVLRAGNTTLLRDVLPADADLIPYALRGGAMDLARSLMREAWGWGAAGSRSR